MCRTSMRDCLNMASDLFLSMAFWDCDGWDDA